MLVQATEKFTDFIFNSAHYLNSPTSILNDNLDSMYRQAKGLENDLAVEWIASYLKKYNVVKPLETAYLFVQFRESITIQEFNKLNVNSYLEKMPEHIKKRNSYLNHWFEVHTHYYSACFGSGNNISHIDSYPFRKE